MKIKLTFILIITLFFVNYSNSQTKTSDCHTVSIKEAIDNQKELLLSDFVEKDIEYVQLEINAYCLINRNLRLFLNDSMIIAVAVKQVFLFDRNTGKFIREIGHVGKDPHGYSETLYSQAYTGQNTILTRAWLPNSFMQYNLMGNFISKKTLKSSQPIQSATNFGDGTTIGYVWNFDGKQKKKLIVFNSGGKEIFSFPQNRSFEYDMNKHGISIFHWEGWFYSFRNQINFYEFATDTIYSITPGRLTPRYVLSYGKYEVPYEIRYTKEFKSNLSEYYFIKSIYESSQFLFFTFFCNGDDHYSGIYHKNSKETKVSQIVENDIDDFVAFKLSSINAKEEIIGYQHTYEISEWLKKHPEKSELLSLKIKNYKGLNSFYNPVVMIGKLKQ